MNRISIATFPHTPTEGLTTRLFALIAVGFGSILTVGLSKQTVTSTRTRNSREVSRMGDDTYTDGTDHLICDACGTKQMLVRQNESYSCWKCYTRNRYTDTDMDQ